VSDPVIVRVYDETFRVSVDDERIGVSITDLVLNTQTVTAEEELYDVEIDISVANTTYVGQALPGTATSASEWRIKRITETVNGSAVDWANGSAAFSHAWTNRLSYTYGP
jgi:hypothetical protein